ncbi:MAG: aminoacyl-tRNA hydrolase [Caulobacteraceae bacterium]
MKQVIVVNEALGLPPGKMAAQVAHAAVGGFLRAERTQQVGWLEAGMPKIVLRCPSETALLALLGEAEAAGLAAMLVRDAGRTVVRAGTATCVGIGPDEAGKIDAITGRLALAV